MNPVTTEGTPSSITAPAAAAAGPPSPAKTQSVLGKLNMSRGLAGGRTG